MPGVSCGTSPVSRSRRRRLQRAARGIPHRAGQHQAERRRHQRQEAHRHRGTEERRRQDAALGHLEQARRATTSRRAAEQEAARHLRRAGAHRATEELVARHEIGSRRAAERLEARQREGQQRAALRAEARHPPAGFRRAAERAEARQPGSPQRAAQDAAARRQQAAAYQRAAAPAVAPPAVVAAPQAYDPEAPALYQEGDWPLLAIRRGRRGTKDPRQRRPRVPRTEPLTLRVPEFARGPRYAFPPLEVVNRGRTAVVDCRDPDVTPRSPRVPPKEVIPIPPALCVPPTEKLPAPASFITVRIADTPRSPNVAQEPTGSPVRPDSTSSLPGTPPGRSTPIPRDDEVTPDSEILLIHAERTPELFSPSLLESPPRNRRRQVPDASRRNLLGRFTA